MVVIRNPFLDSCLVTDHTNFDRLVGDDC